MSIVVRAQTKEAMGFFRYIIEINKQYVINDDG